jgi:hypothetical protein
MALVKQTTFTYSFVNQASQLFVARTDQQIGVARHGDGPPGLAEPGKLGKQRRRSQDRHCFGLGQRVDDLQQVHQCR